MTRGAKASNGAKKTKSSLGLFLGVMKMKKVKVKATVVYEKEYPDDFTDEDILFNLNESSRCASSILCDLEKIDEDNGCLCGLIKHELVK